MSDRKEIWS